MRVRPDGAERFYWQSKQVDTEQNPEGALAALLSDLVVSLREIADTDSVKISAQIVASIADDDGVRGYYFSPDLMSMLAGLRADLDIDVVRDLQ